MTDGKNDLIVLTLDRALPLPALIDEAGAPRFIQFFTANIRNHHTREAYNRDINAFLAWRDVSEYMVFFCSSPNGKASSTVRRMSILSLSPFEIRMMTTRHQ